LSDLVGANCEEAAQVHHLAHSDDDLRQGRLGAEFLALFLGVGFKTGKSILEGDREWDNRISRRVGLDPLGNLGEILVLLPDIVLLAEVDKVDHWLCSQKEKRVDDFHLVALTVGQLS
jgi:hypothetical protein